MLIWIALAVLTVAAAYALMTPLFRAGEDEADEAEPSVAVFADQLAEIDREAERGLLPPDEAEVARREIARRLLRAKERETRLSRAPWRRKLAAAVVVAAVPVIGFGVYGLLGNPQERDLPLAARDPGGGQPMSMEAMLEQVERRLADAPEDGVGWGVVAPIYLGTGRYEEAAEAFQKAIELDGPSAARWIGLGESLMLAERGAISIRAETAFERALALDPAAEKPRIFLAIAARQRGRAEEAVARWQVVLSDAAGDEAWIPLARRELAVLGRPDLLPDAPDAPAATERPGAVTDEMIEGMVARLSERLRAEGGSPEEWIQLIRSELVLGREGRAREALAAGLEDLSGNAAAIEVLRDGAAALGVGDRRGDGEAAGLGQ